MSDDIIERAAKALKPEAWDEQQCRDWPHNMAALQAEAKDSVRTVLQAIQEPNGAMVNAALHWQSHCSDVDSLFSQMISAALHGESLPPHPDLKLYAD